MIFRITKQELESYQSRKTKLFQLLPLDKKIGIYMWEVYESFRGEAVYDVSSCSYIIKDKYYGTSSNPHMLNIIIRLHDGLPVQHLIN